VATFGEATSPERAFARASKEWDELLGALHDSGPEDVAEECADVAIMLCRVTASLGLDLADEIEKKMAKNRARKWPAPGTGPSQHIEEAP
jgi:NTP pyrophosphatase (non-canonical NTP hydrolase)